MTKKRFVDKGKDIFQYGEWWCSAGGEHCADVIATAMNELIEENEQLQKENRNLRFEMSMYEQKIEELEKENKQLKQQEKRLYKYFRKCFDNVSEQGFRETWEVVKKYD